MRYRIFTITAIALAMMAFHGCGDDKPTPPPAPVSTDAAKPADAKPSASDAKPAAAPAAPAAPAK